MRNGERLSLEQIRAFLEATDEFEFKAAKRSEVYAWISQTLCEQEYWKQSKQVRGLVRQYLQKRSGLSRAQVTRLIAAYVETGSVQERPYRRHRFARQYSRADVSLLAEVDDAHETLSGPATRQILQREFEHYGDKRFERLAGVSVAHLYNLRKSRSYREKRLRYEKTRPVQVAIGERRQPDPQGKPGYLRVDTVHQGDLDGVKGVYHINAVDEITQWQVVGASAQIGEQWLIPVLENMLAQFPFRILGFHSDNGSEFINHTVARLLNKLLTEQTKSRPRHSNDNGLVETKNAAVIRKHIGYGYIAGRHAAAITAFYREHLNPYLNFHRPCGVPEIITDKTGKQRRVYRRYATPCELLQKVPQFTEYLKPGVSRTKLQQHADLLSDTEAARRMQQAKRKLFAGFGQKRSA